MASAFLDDEEGQDTTALYAVLNVPKTATQEEVTRAYRKLAQVFHPDKHIDEAKRLNAQESFSKIQEAYEILSDAQKRQVYDVYGKAGLNAGLELGTHLRSREEIRREWEEFIQKQKKAQQEQAVVQKGTYVCRIDARKIMKGQGLGQGPLFRSVVAQSALEAVVSDNDIVSLSGQAAVRPAYRKTPHGLEEVTFGGGNVVFGYKRIISEDDTLDVVAQVGLQTLLSATTTRRLCRLTNRNAWLSTSWNPQMGVGMEVGCSQNLFSTKNDGSVHLVLAPAAGTGVATSITHRGGKYIIQGKLEIGVIHAISARFTYFVNDTITLRAIGRLGTNGIDLELGLARKWSPAITGYVGTVVGYPSGIVLKLRATRAGQSLECPILLSSAYSDWKLVAASYVIPPFTYMAFSRLVVKPLLAWHKRAKEKAKRQETAAATFKALQKATDEQALIEGVARRKLNSELAIPQGKGLIIVHAVYGMLSDYHSHVSEVGLEAVMLRSGSSPARPNSRQGSAEQGGSSTPTQPPSQPPTEVQEPVAASQQEAEQATQEASGSGSNQNQQQPPSTTQGDNRTKAISHEGTPHPWLPVTLALQYLVAGSQLVLHEGVAKSGLMGFTDPAPHTTDKQLLVMYMYQGTAYEIVVGDEEQLQIPGSGNAITDNTQLLAMKKQVQVWERGEA